MWIFKKFCFNKFISAHSSNIAKVKDTEKHYKPSVTKQAMKETNNCRGDNSR